MKTILLLLIHFLANRGIGGIEEVNLKANLRATQNGKRNLGSIKVNFKAIVKEMNSQDKINSKEGSESKRRGSRENNLSKRKGREDNNLSKSSDNKKIQRFNRVDSRNNTIRRNIGNRNSFESNKSKNMVSIITKTEISKEVKTTFHPIQWLSLKSTLNRVRRNKFLSI